MASWEYQGGGRGTNFFGNQIRNHQHRNFAIFHLNRNFHTKKWDHQTQKLNYFASIAPNLTTTFNQNLGISHPWKIRFWPPVKLWGGGGHPTPFPLIWTLKTTHNTSIRGASAPLILIFTRRIWDSKIAEGDTSDHNRGRNAVSSSQKLGVENGSKNTH